MGLSIYAEQGRNGGYTVLSNRLLPLFYLQKMKPFQFSFAFQSLHYYRDLPFNTESKSASHKLYNSLQEVAKRKVDKLQSYIAFWNPKRAIETPLLKAVLELAIENKIYIFNMNLNRVQQRNIFILLVFTHMMDYGICPPLISRNKNIIVSCRSYSFYRKSEENKEKFLNLEEWFCNTYEIKQPIRLHVLLTREGVRQCKSEPNFEDLVVTNEDGTGYIDSIIDKGELNFISPLFYRLCMHAQIVEPKEFINILRQQAKDILSIYPEKD